MKQPRPPVPGAVGYSETGMATRGAAEAVESFYRTEARRVFATSEREMLMLSFDGDLSKDAPADWNGSLRQTVIQGCFMDEVVFFHAASKTLILADGIENFELDKIKQPYRFFVWATGACHPRGQMPIGLRSSFWPKKHAVRAAVAEMISWQPERIIVSHGRCIDQDAIGALRFAFRWAL